MWAVPTPSLEPSQRCQPPGFLQPPAALIIYLLCQIGRVRRSFPQGYGLPWLPGWGTHFGNYKFHDYCHTTNRMYFKVLMHDKCTYVGSDADPPLGLHFVLSLFHWPLISKSVHHLFYLDTPCRNYHFNLRTLSQLSLHHSLLWLTVQLYSTVSHPTGSLYPTLQLTN
jgi:hypothetical protein